MMFPVFADVPGLPAGLRRVLGRGRDLRPGDGPPPARLRGGPARRRPAARRSAHIPRRLAGLVEYALVQTKMFKDPRAGLMHAGIFWGFVLLTIGTANIVTGGVIQTVLSDRRSTARSGPRSARCRTSSR